MSPQVHEYEFRLLELNQAYSAEILGRAVLAIGAIGRAKDSAVSEATISLTALLTGLGGI